MSQSNSPSRAGKKRVPISLSPKLDHNLLAYAAAATAAGVGILALSPSADAEIVYTPTHQVLKPDSGIFHLDLNNDGINDFRFSDGYFTSIFARRGAFPTGNTSRVTGYLDVAGSVGSNRAVAGNKGFALALPQGVKVGSARQFGSGSRLGLMAYCNAVGGNGSTNYGFWDRSQKDRYLGFKFVISGEIHYGWARFNVGRSRCAFKATLTGYAYETLANTPIVTGKTSGTDEVGGLESSEGTLGALAQGALVSVATPAEESATANK
jgi:hypothetical protein